jgi:hypothetical protein
MMNPTRGDSETARKKKISVFPRERSGSFYISQRGFSMTVPNDESRSSGVSTSEA